MAEEEVEVRERVYGVVFGSELVENEGEVKRMLALREEGKSLVRIRVI